MNNGPQHMAVRNTIRARRTWKVMGDPSAPVSFDAQLVGDWDQAVLDSISDAGMAPFHYHRRQDGIAEPWRFHVIWHQDCRVIAREFHHWFQDLKPGNKLPAMLSACGALVLCNWIPETDRNDEKIVQLNEEHLAATSAAVQNLLLLLTAQGMGTYWSSGGQFRTPAMFERLGVPLEEKLLAAVFVDYPSTRKLNLERIAGKQHDHRSAAERWSRVVQLGQP